jgi:hypothetical protein
LAVNHTPCQSVFKKQMEWEQQDLCGRRVLLTAQQVGGLLDHDEPTLSAS